MSNPESIHGKVDSGHHDGMYASVRHLAETDEEVIDFWMNVWPELVNYVLYGEKWEKPPVDTEPKT